MNNNDAKREQILTRLNSYNPSIVYVEFTLHTKSIYAEVFKSVVTITPVDDEFPIAYINNDRVFFVIFPKSNIDDILSSCNILDSYVNDLNNNHADYMYLKTNFCDLDKKEQRLVKFLNLNLSE